MDYTEFVISLFAITASLLGFTGAIFLLQQAIRNGNKPA